MKNKLSKEQQEIVLFNNCEGALLVEASAGSGKTRILTERVRYLLTEKEDKFFAVLCLTFTTKAAEEMKKRLEVDISKLSQRSFIGTFHKFCLEEIIKNYRHEIGLKEVPHLFEKEDDRKKVIINVINDNEVLKEKYKSKNPKEQAILIHKCLNFISANKRKLLRIPDDINNWANWGEDNTYLYKNYNYELQNQNAMDYDDILLYAYRILTERPAVANILRRKYKYILVDEAQDLNFAQYQIIKAICGDSHRNVMMVGDPNQAIYAFNGASTKYMQQDFKTDFDATIKQIDKNYRSSTEVLKLAHHIRPNGGMPDNYFQGEEKIIPFENEIQEAEWIIENIKKWKEKGVYEEAENEMSIPIELDNIVVLARNKYIFRELINLLDKDDELKDNYYIRKGINKFEPESQLIKALDLGLRILVNPNDILHFNQLHQELGLPIQNDNNNCERLLTLDRRTDLDDKQKRVINLLLDTWNELNTKPQILDKVLSDLNKKVIKDSLFPYEEKLKIDFDIQEFLKLWKAFLRSTSSSKQLLAGFRYFLALNNTEEKREGLTLATVHTVKGLEYEIVFLMGMNQGVLPDYRAKDKSALEEERNNAYVAVTRAKKCIYITYPKNRMMPWGESKVQKASSFIKKIENI